MKVQSRQICFHLFLVLNLCRKRFRAAGDYKSYRDGIITDEKKIKLPRQNKFHMMMQEEELDEIKLKFASSVEACVDGDG